MNKIASLPPVEVVKALGHGALLVDVRLTDETDIFRFKVPEVVYVPLSALYDSLDKLPRNRALVVADMTGPDGYKAANLLKFNGFEQVSYMEGGMQAWNHERLPIVCHLEGGHEAAHDHGSCGCSCGS